MDKMPEYKEGFVTLWSGGKWVSVPMSDIPKVQSHIGEPSGTQESPNLPAGK